MKTREMEEALLVLHSRTSHIELEQLLFDHGDATRVTGTTVNDALLAAAEYARPGGASEGADNTEVTTAVDRFAAAQAFVLGVNYSRSNADDARAELEQLGDALLQHFDSSGDDATEPLIGAIDQLIHGEPVTSVRDQLTAAFGSALAISDASETAVAFDGPGASLATMLLDLATNLPSCRTRYAKVLVDGTPKEVTLVEVDVCTHASYAHCVHGVNPLNWPQCNPYFLSVQPVGSTTSYPDGWSAVVREQVGPALNLSVYTTDLAVRYLENPKLAAVTFDLAPTRGDDGRVSVDRGFLSVTDEGVHRRFRTLKVYRIEDLDTPHHWVCALWCWQVVMSGWWCA